MKKTVLLAFSGGLDSTTCAIKLRDAGHLVTLGYVDWEIEGSSFGLLQAAAAVQVAEKLDLKLEILAQCRLPKGHQTKGSWVQAIASMILWEAAFPIMRYDAVAFGMQITSHETWQRMECNRAVVENIAKVVNYGGEILYPVDGIGRQEQWKAMPDNIGQLIWCCNIPTDDGRPCGHCYKCKHDFYASYFYNKPYIRNHYDHADS